MRYLSSKEIGAKWGVSSVRVGVLAREGRIAGAKMIGKSWMIPENAEKPSDQRKTEIKIQKKRLSQEQGRRSHSLLLLNLSREELNRKLKQKDEEGKLCLAQVRLHAGRLEESAELIDEVMEQTQEAAYYITALYSRCLWDYFSGNIRQIESDYIVLRSLIEKYYPDSPAMELLLMDIRSYFAGNEDYIKEDVRNITEKAAEEGEAIHFSYLSMIYSTMIQRFVEKKRYNIDIFEIICLDLENRHYDYAAQMMHLWMAIYYYLDENRTLSVFHYKRAVSYAEKCSSYLVLLVGSRYLEELEEEVYQDCSPAFRDMVRRIADRFEGGQPVMDCEGEKCSTIPKLLTPKAYTLLLTVSQGCTNKQIAEQMGYSDVTVNKWLSELYQEVGVRSKKELIQYCREIMKNYRYIGDEG